MGCLTSRHHDEGDTPHNPREGEKPLVGGEVRHAHGHDALRRHSCLIVNYDVYVSSWRDGARNFFGDGYKPNG